MTKTSHRLRFAEYVPPLREADARRLRGLPPSWGARVPESEIDALAERGKAIADALAARGRSREAEDLRRAVALFERVAELHEHALRVETLAQLYASLVTLFGERAPADASEPSLDQAPSLLQSGALADAEEPGGHGPAFRATAALRSRAFRLLEAAVTRYARSLGAARR